ncbi:DNA methylase [Youhaiella tibetensis]|uniref:Metallophosphoesterase family protein n=1 Tax=Paradevosia tibetensis TaxID=1447062 RepID=A0A5B9DR98_9HYPH|nr:metallophosphoesterase family protein [Youhaiella tibetensis]AKR56554.1 Serine/threonine protein phosphatase [Devosia sp. H5989]QEE21592.1 metallophosphoesterase family protein [Youhaiella tibetensis]GGF13464.1 DNA methylase [Youhaiella tibetensis]
MRLAVVSDIHGNSFALEAVLEDIARQGVDATVNLGDTLSGPIDPRRTGDLLLEMNAATVRGNHDRYLVETGVFELGAVDRFALAQLDPRHVVWLESLPATRVVEGEVFLCHGTPRDDNAVWLDNFWTARSTTLPDEASVTAKAEGFDYPVLLCGHTHLERSVRLRDGRMVVNPGSVGLQTVHGSPDARYAIVEKRDGKWSVTQRVLGYDHEAAARRAEENGFPHWREALTTGWGGPEGLF